jgi:GNAT superfamily N-acetyltransferase
MTTLPARVEEVSVRAVQSNREKKQFFYLPWELYRGDPNWIPPLRANQWSMLGYKHHPFYDDAEAQTFLALRGGKPCGRVAAIINHAHNRKYEEQRGFFGFFECIDDQAVAAALFDAARAWLAERNITKLRGPMNPSVNYEIGTLIEGFDSPPTFMMTYNPPYHLRLLEEYGFVGCQDLYAFWGKRDMLTGLDQKLAFVVNEATRRFGVKLRTLDTRHYARDVRIFLEIYNESFASHWASVPLSESELAHLGKEMKHLIVPHITAIAEIDGKPAGAVFGLLDYNPRIKQINGRLFPFGFIRLLWNRKSIKRVRLISTNVVPAYQRWGLGLVLLAQLLPAALNQGCEEVEFSWVAESNHLSRASLERGGAKRIKSYRVFDYGPAEVK